MKRFCFLLTLLLLLALPCSAARHTEQVLDLKLEDHTLSLTATKPITFFEKPQLQAGETVLLPGTLILKNSTAVSRDFTLDEVVFPYDDPAALEYLNHLQLEVRKDDQTIYSGAYSGINHTQAREAFDCTVKAGESVTFTVYLKCDYSYGGTEYLGDAVLDWKFDTPVLPSDLPVEEEPKSFSDPLIWQWLIGGGIALVLFSALLFVSRKIKP